jgi:hypothetical protein
VGIKKKRLQTPEIYLRNVAMLRFSSTDHQKGGHYGRLASFR